MIYFSIKQLMSRLVFGWASVAVLLVILAQVAFACGYSPPDVVIKAQVSPDILSQGKKCLDKDCLFIFTKDGYGYPYITSSEGFRFGSIDVERKTISMRFLRIYRDNPNPSINKSAFIEALDTLIDDDISDIKPLFFQEVETWANKWITGKKSGFIDSDLMFVPYSQNEELKISRNDSRLLACRYAEHKRVGDWLVIDHSGREYCYYYQIGGGACGNVMISYPKFFFFLLSNINGTTFPYLFFLTMIVVASISFIRHLVLKGEFWAFVRPQGQIFITVVAAILLFISQLPFWYAMLIYFIASMSRYAKRQKREKDG